MAKVSPYLRTYGDSKGNHLGYTHWCPGCEEFHIITTVGSVKWSFNNDVNKPTFNPSVRITGIQKIMKDGEWQGDWVKDDKDRPVQRCCHYFLRDGELHYLNDCTHKFKGMMILLPEIPTFQNSSGVTNVHSE